MVANCYKRALTNSALLSGNTHKTYVIIICVGVLLVIVYNRHVSHLKVLVDCSAGPSLYLNTSVLYTAHDTPADRNTSDLDQGAPTVVKHTVKKILLWTPYYNSKFYGFGEGETGFKNANYDCKVKACTLTDDRTQLDVADAVVFHAAELRTRPPLPKHANDRQVFVFLVYESPMSVRQVRIANLSGVFNMTITYMDDSETDVHVPYGKVIPRIEPLETAVPTMRQIQLKTKLVAWMVSNCHPMSSRKDYAEELSAYIRIDIFGRCGNLTCPKSNASCVNELTAEHMFMLSFENGYCTDYMTEKLFRALRSNIVPVTLGRVNYSKFLPPKSFIDVRDFSSPRVLAEYLMYLSDNRTAYAEYFEWKRTHVAMERGYTRPRGFCRLCQILHDTTYTFKTNFDPSEYWGRTRNCLNGSAERKEVHLIPS